MRRIKPATLFPLFLLLVLIVVTIFTYQEKPKQYPPYDIHSPSPTGTKGIITYLHNNMDATIDKKAPSNKTEDRQIRLLIDPALFSKVEVEEAYLDYIMAGNTLVIWKENPDELFDIRTEYSFNTLSVIGESEETTVYSKDDSYRATIFSSFRISPEEEDTVLLEDEDGSAIAIERTIGDGKLIVSTEPRWLTNHFILSSDHLDLITEILPFYEDGEWIIDSLSANHSTSSVPIYEVYGGWVYVIILCGIVLAILLLWHLGKRFGPVHDRREDKVRYSNERIKAISIWHVKGKHFKEALNMQLDYLKEIIRARYGIPVHLSWENRLQQIQRFLSIQNVDKLAQRIQHIEMKKKIDKQEFLAWSKWLDEIREEVERK